MIKNTSSSNSVSEDLFRRRLKFKLAFCQLVILSKYIESLWACFLNLQNESTMRYSG